MSGLRKNLAITAIAAGALGGMLWASSADAGSITVSTQEGAASCTTTGATTGNCPNGGDIYEQLQGSAFYAWPAGTNYGDFHTSGNGNDEDLGGTDAQLPTVLTTASINATLVTISKTTPQTFTVYVTSQGLNAPTGDSDWTIALSATLPAGWSETESVYLNESNGLYNSGSCAVAPCATDSTTVAGGSDEIGTHTFTNTGSTQEVLGHTISATDSDVTAPFSLTEVFTITGFWNGSDSEDHNSPGSIDVTAAAVPEPASLSLLGSALVGFGMWRRRRSRKA